MTAGSVGFLVHPRERADAVDAGVAAARRHGFATWLSTGDPAAALGAHAEGCRLLVTVGGDGTFLLGARLAGPRGIPVLGVNRGQLGFLTDVELERLPEALDCFAAGGHRVQRRSLLELTVPGGAGGEPLVHTLALNEVVVKSTGTNLARLRVDADGELLGEFDADGIIVATATGSTAYALSAGGPPVDPRVRATLVVPLAPFAVLTRAIVLPEMVSLAVTVVRGRTVVAADGSVEAPLAEGTRLRVEPGPELQVVQATGSVSFLGRLREKMRLGMPLKQPSGGGPEEQG